RDDLAAFERHDERHGPVGLLRGRDARDSGDAGAAHVEERRSGAGRFLARGAPKSISPAHGASVTNEPISRTVRLRPAADLGLRVSGRIERTLLGLDGARFRARGVVDAEALRGACSGDRVARHAATRDRIPRHTAAGDRAPGHAAACNGAAWDTATRDRAAGHAGASDRIPRYAPARNRA